MVRLDAEQQKANAATTAAFQFQYGAIRCNIQAAAEKLSKEVSIPIWCD